jgi:hypothetical protein
MNTVVIVVVVVAALVIGGLALLVSQRRKSAHLAERFGPEYERAVSTTGSKRQAEAELGRREQRVEALQLRPLGRPEQERFASEWRAVQARFVDDPSGAVHQADTLVGQVLQARGYPVSDFEQRAADISVDHPVVVDNYRAAHAIAQRIGDRGATTTEELRQAMVHYRALFDDVLETPVAPDGAMRPTDDQTQEGHP